MYQAYVPYQCQAMVGRTNSDSVISVDQVNNLTSAGIYEIFKTALWGYVHILVRRGSRKLERGVLISRNYKLQLINSS